MGAALGVSLRGRSVQLYLNMESWEDLDEADEEIIASKFKEDIKIEGKTPLEEWTEVPQQNKKTDKSPQQFHQLGFVAFVAGEQDNSEGVIVSELGEPFVLVNSRDFVLGSPVEFTLTKIPCGSFDVPQVENLRVTQLSSEHKQYNKLRLTWEKFPFYFGRITSVKGSYGFITYQNNKQLFFHMRGVIGNVTVQISCDVQSGRFTQ